MEFEKRKKGKDKKINTYNKYGKNTKKGERIKIMKINNNIKKIKII